MARPSWPCLPCHDGLRTGLAVISTLLHGLEARATKKRPFGKLVKNPVLGTAVWLPAVLWTSYGEFLTAKLLDYYGWENKIAPK